jgi:hypothetical protein
MYAEIEKIKGIKDTQSNADITVGRAKTKAGYRNFMDRFHEKLKYMLGAANVNLHYVIRKVKPVGWTLTDPEEIELYSLRHDGPEYLLDNFTLMRILFGAANQPRAMVARMKTGQYLLGSRPTTTMEMDKALCWQSKFTTKAKPQRVVKEAQVEKLYFKDEATLPFEKFTSDLKDAFDTCGIYYTEEQKIDQFLEKFNTNSKAAEVNTIKLLATNKHFTTSCKKIC